MYIKKKMTLLLFLLFPLGSYSNPAAQTQLELGFNHSKGALTAPDYVKAVQYYSLAAAQKDPTAQFALALCHQLGLGVVKDYSSALYWYHQAVSNHLPGGIQIPAHLVRGREVLSTLSLAGSEEYHIALTTKNASSAPKNSLEWLKTAAQKGHSQAQYQLALNYLTGSETIQDDTKALYWLKKAAAKNHQEAQSYLAWMTLVGLGTEPDIEKAVHWFLQARKNDQSSTPKTAVNELSPSEDPLSKEAYMAQFEQGTALFEGQFEEADVNKGLTLIEQAAINGLGSAQLYLARLYEQGKKVSRDPSKAAKWYKKCAQHGNTQAEIALGWLYYNGDGVPQDKLAALQWFDKARIAGDKQAASAKAFISAQLSAEQLAQEGAQTVASKSF